MFDTNDSYHQRRAIEERARAHTASDARAASAHAQLADMHERAVDFRRAHRATA